MTAPLDAPGRVDRAAPPRARPPVHLGRAVRRPPRAARVERRPAQGAGAVPRRHARTCSTSAPSPTTSSSAPTRSGTRRRCACRYQSLTTPASVYDVDVVTGERTLRKQTPTPERRPRAATSRRARGRRRPTARRCPSTSSATSTPRSTAPAPAVVYGYGSYEASMPPWFSVGPRSRCSTAACVWALVHPRGGGELGRQLVPRRQAAAQAQHVHRHARRRRAPRRRGLRRPGARRDPRRQRRRAARRRVRHDAPGPVRQRRRRGPVRRRRHDDERRDAAADGHRVGGVGRPARRAVRQLHARLLAVRQHRPPATTRRCTSRPGSTIRGSATTSRRSGWPGCAPSAPAATACSCCAPRWAPATAARAVATTPGATRPARSRSSCDRRCASDRPSGLRDERISEQATMATTIRPALRTRWTSPSGRVRPRAEAGARRVPAVDELAGDRPR